MQHDVANDLALANERCRVLEKRLESERAALGIQLQHNQRLFDETIKLRLIEEQSGTIFRLSEQVQSEKMLRAVADRKAHEAEDVVAQQTARLNIQNDSIRTLERDYRAALDRLSSYQRTNAELAEKVERLEAECRRLANADGVCGICGLPGGVHRCQRFS